jgi:hypothetical protein
VEEPPQYFNEDESAADEAFPRFEPRRAAPRGTPRAGGRGHRPPPGQTNPWLVGIAIAFVLGAISIIAFVALAPDNEGGAAPDTTLADGGTTTTLADGGTITTLADGETSTTATDGSTAATLPDGQTPPITPADEAVPIEELTMKSDGVGDYDFGDNGDLVLGVFAATFGDPTQDTGFFVGNGFWGECPGDPIRVVQWGPLNIVVKGEAGDSQFIAYRMDLAYGGRDAEPVDMQTLSGLRVGETVGDLKEIYEDWPISFIVDPDVGGLVFQLRLETGGDVLLWGPVDSADDDALVTGIYSPKHCES